MTALADLRHALRGLRRTPGFALAAVLTLALGIGANTAVFSVVNGVLLRPLPYPSPERLAYLTWDWGGGGAAVLSPLKYDYYRTNATSFAGVATVRGRSSVLGDGAEAREVRGLYVDDAFFTVFGVLPAIGRTFAPEEYVEGGGGVALLGHELWRTQFGADPGVIGKTLPLEGQPLTIVGIMPAGFHITESPSYDGYFAPFRLAVDPADGSHNHLAVARLADGIAPDGAQAELDALTARFRAEYPNLVDGDREHMSMTDYSTLFVGDLQGTLWILLGAVAFVLLIACTNVANLLLVRASDRRREIAIRTAIGGGRGRILRQLLTESVSIAVIAGIVGVAAGAWTVDGLLALVPESLPRSGEIGLDARVLAFALTISAVTGVLFGLATALPALRGNIVGVLREGDRGAPAGPGARRVRNGLVVAETAVACVLLAGASLLIASFSKLRAVDPGFAADGIVAASFPRLPEGLDAAQLWQFQERALAQLTAHPALAAAATTSSLPLERGMNAPMTIVGNRDATESIEWRSISPDYFDVLGIERLGGRAFEVRDAASATAVAIVNESFARKHFPDGNALGQQLQIGAYRGEMVMNLHNEPPRTIVGVVADVKEIGLDLPARTTVYVPQAQTGWIAFGPPHFLIRTDRPAVAIDAAQRLIGTAEPRMPRPEFRQLTDIMGASLAQERFNTLLMTLFAVLALVLTAVGLYGVLSYTVRQRTREIGIRMALGANRHEVLRMVVGHGVALAFVGLIIGLTSAVWLTRLLESMLFDVQPGDPVAYASVALLLLIIAALASYLPARRAMRVPPIIALRQE